MSDATYYPFGPASRWTFGNGRVLRRSLNQNYQPGFVEDTAPGDISEGYGFDEVGNLASLRYANQLEPPRRSNTYDGMNRVPTGTGFPYENAGRPTVRRFLSCLRT